MGSREKTVEKWQQLIEDMYSSGKKQRIWCEENDVGYSTMRKWANIFSKDEQQRTSSNNNKFVQVKVNDVNTPELNEGNLLLNAGKFSVTIPHRFNEDNLHRVCEVLARLC